MLSWSYHSGTQSTWEERQVTGLSDPLRAAQLGTGRTGNWSTQVLLFPHTAEAAASFPSVLLTEASSSGPVFASIFSATMFRNGERELIPLRMRPEVSAHSGTFISCLFSDL